MKKTLAILVLLSLAQLTISFQSVGASPNCGFLQLPDTIDDPVLRWHPYLQNTTQSSVTVRWATRILQPGTIEYWEPSKASNTLTAVSTLLAASTTLLNFDMNFHEVKIANLSADTDYCYKIAYESGGNNVTIASGLYFHTAWGANRPEVRFIAFGDSGDHFGTALWVRRAFMSRDSNGNFRYPFDFTMALGDLAYDSGTYNDFDKRYFFYWQGANTHVNPSLDVNSSFMWRTPTFTTVGNHEYDNGSSNAATYFNLFDLPVNSEIPSEDAERYYSFDYGNVHFVSIDGNKFGEIGNSDFQSMLQWLDDDLTTSRAFWKIAFTHQAPYSYGSHGTSGDQTYYYNMRRHLLPVLQKHGVGLLFSGHEHQYMRTKRMKVDSNGMILREGGLPADPDRTPDVGPQITPIVESNDGIVYIVAGNGGADIHDRQASPGEPGAIDFDRGNFELYGEGFDFAAKRPETGEPVLYDNNQTPDAPTYPASRWGFVYVVVKGCLLTLRALNDDQPQQTEMDLLTLSRCQNDLNKDDIIDSKDLGVMMSRWGDTVDPSGSGPDFENNGVVDKGDLEILLQVLN